ncbi:saccharopine dehydrogenase-like oxidoreductase isoform X2 [Bacillus rossius redtenbacheri]|uniref:saccharopine dehydrogenase-like oxidoreductase isoform X2 n=1 Tax=Bacillus rossius redtenbacheri TaxID=93214 RepID=UPI002FDD2A4F
MASSSKLDVVVFGASGVTGGFAVEKLLEFSQEVGNLKWGVAGRNVDKLSAVLSKLSKKTDVKDDESLRKMAGQVRVVINCVGPYVFHGEAVVKACVDAGAHYVDVTGEPQFMEKMQLQYHELAKQNGVYIVSSCGYDSIPADLGTVFLTNNFQGEVNSIEAYMKFTMKKFKWGPSVNYGTLHSAVYLLSEVHSLKEIRQKLFQEQLPRHALPLKHKWFVHRNEDVGGWSVPFPGPDRSVVHRSQRYFYQNEKQRPVQMCTYITFPWLLVALTMWLFGGLFLLLIKTSFGRNLVLKYPKLLTGGFIGVDEISEECAENVDSSLFLCGKGWKDKALEPSDQHFSAPDKKIIVKVSGTNPVYGVTCTALVWSAITILHEADKMPSSGGVYPPGAAFKRTSLIEKLNKHGLKFEVVSKQEK